MKSSPVNCDQSSLLSADGDWQTGMPGADIVVVEYQDNGAVAQVFNCSRVWIARP